MFFECFFLHFFINFFFICVHKIYTVGGLLQYKGFLLSSVGTRQQRWHLFTSLVLVMRAMHWRNLRGKESSSSLSGLWNGPWNVCHVFSAILNIKCFRSITSTSLGQLMSQTFCFSGNFVYYASIFFLPTLLKYDAVTSWICLVARNVDK